MIYHCYSDEPTERADNAVPQFFRHEKGKKIGVSTLAIVIAPFLGTMYVS